MSLYLIVRIEDAQGNTVETFARGGQKPGDVRLCDVQSAVRGLQLEIGTTRAPLRAVAYKSPNRDGVGRVGGQFQTFGARRT